MQRRDLIRGALLLGSGVLVSGQPLASLAWTKTQTMPLITLLEDSMNIDSLITERDKTSSKHGEVWRLPIDKLLQPDDYLARLHNRTGTQLRSLLGAANHCLLLDTLRLHGAELHAEQRIAALPGAPRYVLYATL
ncbi:hypothetical protein [Pseudomonas citronellolis]|uniref:hypothetical protein n=1 Tax=Pseudomonas citronellolis TaxID=53408 RepID=UPI00078E5437|nr:hypothetical protein [Pseudomonas citronellolis]AMO76077.1 hypothetical protein PcP3B5_26430 [Pseudomonas citronellolis]